MIPKKTIHKRLIPFAVLTVLSIIVNLLINVNQDNIIVNSGIGAFKVFTVMTRIVICIFAGLFGFSIARYFIKRKPISEKAVDLSVKKGISKSELIEKINSLITAWRNKDGEYFTSVKYLEQAKGQLSKIDSIYNTLNLLVENNNEGSLEEVQNVIRSAEKQLVSNTVAMLNHIFLEISIDGFDDVNIVNNLENNDGIISECSKLLKAALLYMDGKGSEQGIGEYIKSMIETLNKLKGD